MGTYFITETATREGMMTVTEAPKRAEGVVAAAAAFDVEIVEWFYTTGPFDFIMKVTAPSDEAVAAFVMAVRRSGNVTAQMTKAFTPAEWTAIVERIPS